MAKLIGSWDMISQENFDEYMKACGVGMVMRKMGNTIKPTVVVEQSGDTWTLKALSTFKNTEIKFKANEEFDETTADGRHVKTTVTIDSDSKFTQHQKGDKDSTLSRELMEDGTMVLTCQCGDVKATRTYKRKD